MSWITQEEVVRLIEDARLDLAPERCPACESTVDARRLRCFMCGEVKPITAFVRDYRKPHGYEKRCRACDRERRKRNHVERKRRQFREILGVAS